MKKILTAFAVLGAISGPSAAAEIAVMSYGGAYTKSQMEAYYRPFTKETGIKVISVDADNPATPVKIMAETGNVTVDVANVEESEVVRLCGEGLLEKFDASILPPAPDGTPASKDFFERSINECGVATVIWSTVYAYDKTRFPNEKPTTVADFFDLKKFPGKRGLIKKAKRTLEMALFADGVPADQIYKILATPEGVNRAFAKLDTIKASIVWWEAGAQPLQLLADGEVVMTTAYNGRVFDAVLEENKPFESVWDGQYLVQSLYVIPKGAKNIKAATDFIVFATGTQRLADQASWISYGPARKSSSKLVGLYRDGKTEMASHMPTAEKNMATAIHSDPEFWIDYGDELNNRFSVWLLR